MFKIYQKGNPQPILKYFEHEKSPVIESEDIVNKVLSKVEQRLVLNGSAYCRTKALGSRVRNVNDNKNETTLKIPFETNDLFKGISLRDNTDFVAHVTGLYLISFSCSVLSGTRNTSCSISIIKNGNTIADATKFVSSLSQDTMTLTTLEPLSINDKVYIVFSIKGPSGSYAEIQNNVKQNFIMSLQAPIV
jgi:hypothetical protein